MFNEHPSMLMFDDTTALGEHLVWLFSLGSRSGLLAV